MSRIALYFALVFCCSGFLLPGAASAAGAGPDSALAADGEERSAAPNTTLWYRFGYGGGKSQIRINLIDGGAADIGFQVYTPEEIAAWLSGGRLHAIGQMTRTSGVPSRELSWSGNFRTAGTYYVAVRNPTGVALSHRVVVLGDRVQVERMAGRAADESRPAPTPDPVQVSRPAPAAPMPSNLIAGTIPVAVPGYVGAPSVSVPLGARPGHCTPPGQMPAVVYHSVSLCPGQVYAPFTVRGSNITLFGDPGAIVRGPARGFAITVTGSNVTIVGVNVEAVTHPADLNNWLCLYEFCTYSSMYRNESVRGGLAYGGGILLQNTTNAAVIASTVRGGVIGVASTRGFNNKIVNNNLSDLSGWGVFLHFTNRDYAVGNTLNRVDRACVGPDGVFYQSGCESSALTCLGCQASVIVANHCEHGGNCFYATGEGGASDNNKFYENYCAASANNCFEITFTQGNEFDYNVATFDPYTLEGCNYPFWIAGSTVYFGRHNTWACNRSQERAIEGSKNGTNAPTEVRQL